MFRLDREMRRGFAFWLRRRPAPALPIGQTFGYLERGSYPTVVAIVLVSIFSEVPFTGLILSIFVDDPSRRLLAHLLLGALSAYSLVWLLADRWAVRGSAHVLTDSYLELQVGSHTRCQVPLQAIASCTRVEESPATWCAQHGRVLVVTPFDRQNAVLALDADSDVHAWHHGEQRARLTHVFLYVDRPDALRAALSNHRA